MSNEKWDDLDRDLTMEDIADLNIDDILKEFEEKSVEAEPVQIPAEPTPAAAPKAEVKDVTGKPGGWQKSVLQYLHDLVYLLSALIVVFLLLFRVVVVSGTSMNNTLYDGDYLLLLGNTFYHNPAYGDVIVASKESFDNGSPIVKRVIATEGQWVDINFDIGIIFVGDTIDTMRPLEEPYIIGMTRQNGGMKFPLQVSEGCLFVMGDNRENSRDSRYLEIGLIDKREVLGKVFFLFLPGSNKGMVEPDYGRVGVVE